MTLHIFRDGRVPGFVLPRSWHFRNADRENIGTLILHSWGVVGGVARMTRHNTLLFPRIHTGLTASVAQSVDQ